MVQDQTIYQKKLKEVLQNEPQIYDRSKKEDIDRLTYIIRRQPLDNQKVYMDLGDGLYIHTTRARCYLNAQIFTILDEYSIPKNRKQLIFNRGVYKSDMKDYIETVLDTLIDMDFPHKNILLTHVLADIKCSFASLSFLCNGVVSVDHSLLDYSEAYEKVPEFKKIFDEPVFSKHDNPWVIQQKADNVINKFKDGSINIEPLTDFLKFGVKVKPDQILMFMCYAMAPNFLNPKEVLPPLGVGIIDGVRKLWDLYVLDMISRLATITMKADVKETGLQSKRLSIVLSNTKLNRADTRETLDDCHAKFYFKTKIKNEKDLEHFSWKHIYDPNTHQKIGYVNKKDKSLIGKEVYLRTFMLCLGDIVCKECYGYTWNYVVDTELYKGNFLVYTLQIFNKKMQSVISIKHHSVAILKALMVWYGSDKARDILNVLENDDIIIDMDFDKIKINPKYKVEFIPEKIIIKEEPIRKPKKTKENAPKKKKRKRPRRTETRIKEQLWINGIEFKTEQKITKIDEYTYKLVIPNDSVLSQAYDLNTLVNGHSTAKGDFNPSDLNDKTLEEQVHIIYEYVKTKVKLDHFIHYEALIHALVKDANDPSSRLNEDTKLLLFTHANHALTQPERTKELSTILPHGFMGRIMSGILTNFAPSEMDILYAGLKPRQILNRNIFSEYNRIIENNGKIISDVDSIQGENENFNTEEIFISEII